MPLASLIDDRNAAAMRIEIVVFDGFDEIDAIGPFEVLDSAAQVGAPFDVVLVGADGPAEIQAQHGLRMVVEEGLGRPDAVIVPGGGWLNHAPEGAWTQARRGALPRRLAELAGTVRWTASVCSGAMLLAEAGLLRGRPATTNHNLLTGLGETGAVVTPHRIVDDGDIITAGGLTAGLDLGLWLIEREVGPELAATIADNMEYLPRNDVWRRTEPAPVV
jgi:transcriptional regulator GlxA family with amidase domain